MTALSRTATGAAIRSEPRTMCPKNAFLPVGKQRNGTITCSVEAIRHSRELEGKRQAEAEVVVAITRLVVVPVGGAAVRRIVEVAAAAVHAIGALRRLTFLSINYFFPKHRTFCVFRVGNK